MISQKSIAQERPGPHYSANYRLPPTKTPMAKQKMKDPRPAASDLPQGDQQIVAAVLAVSQAEFGRVAPRLARLFSDVADLYAGHWPTHEACAVPYHSFNHALDVSLAVARMISGWNKVETDRPFSEEHLHLGMAAALFHDAGYIKDKGDHEGSGGKFTLVHVSRSMTIARDYLVRQQDWKNEEAEVVAALISITDHPSAPDIEPLFTDPHHKNLARMLATADLVAQMADSSYLRRMDDLFAEFKEVYAFEKTESLSKKGTRVYRTVEEIKEGTISFYEHFVMPSLKKLGRMDRYLTNFFADGRNPYQENITANLSCHLMDVRSQWRRIGDVLEELGLASAEQIRHAVELQRKLSSTDSAPGKNFNLHIREQLLPWFTRRSEEGHCLGDLLMQTEAVSPGSLAKGLLAQMLPDSLYKALSAKELLFLLQTAILLQNICKGPWILGVVMEMVNEILACEASSILIADPDDTAVLVVLPTGPKKNPVYGKAVAIDKGLSGWVYRNGQPATLNNLTSDDRFDRHVDGEIGFVTRSALAVPLHVNGECVGAVEALNKHDMNFSQHDTNILSILANMLANVMAGILWIRSNQ